MKKILQRVWLLLLTVILTAVWVPFPVFAGEPDLVYVETYCGADGVTGWLPLLNVNGEAYITVENINALLGEGSMTSSRAVVNFTYGSHKGSEEFEFYERNGEYWYPLQKLADLAWARYYYNESTETLYFLVCDTFAENLLTECCDMIDSGTYNLLNIESEAGTALSYVYNVLGGMRVDVLWGGYQDELYRSVVSELMFDSSDQSDTLKYLSKWDKTLMKLATLDEYRTDGEEWYIDLYNWHVVEFGSAYKTIAEQNPYLSFGEALGILKNADAAIHADETFTRAVKTGLCDNPSGTSQRLYTAANDVYDYYRENYTFSFAAILRDYGMDQISDAVSKLVKDNVVKDILGINTIKVKIAKMLIDEYSPVDELMNATIYTSIAREIQQAAVYAFRSAQGKYLVSGDSDHAVAMKYCAILYLRACEFAYKEYADADPELKNSVDPFCEKVDALIEGLAAYDDGLFTHYDNAAIDLSCTGFYTDIPREIIEEPEQDDPTEVPEEEETTPSRFGDGYTLVDGEYIAEVLPQNVYEADYGWRFYADTYEPVTLTDEEADALKVGDELLGIPIEKRERKHFRNGTSICDIIELNDSELLYLMYDKTAGLWYVHGVDDAVMTRYVEKKEFRITRDAECVDDFTWYAFGQGEKNMVLSGFDAFFNNELLAGFYASGNGITLKLTVSGGVITKTVLEYSP